MADKEQVVIQADLLTNIFKREWIKWSTGMKQKHKYVCVDIPVGKPILDENTWEMVQKKKKRYLDRDISALLISSKELNL